MRVSRATRDYLPRAGGVFVAGRLRERPRVVHSLGEKRTRPPNETAAREKSRRTIFFPRPDAPRLRVGERGVRQDRHSRHPLPQGGPRVQGESGRRPQGRAFRVQRRRAGRSAGPETGRDVANHRVGRGFFDFTENDERALRTRPETHGEEKRRVGVTGSSAATSRSTRGTWRPGSRWRR